ncbi:MAG TPA: hypothetical protein DHV62_05290 [Elusimicrobia bacterium]|jgi:hypothetical protein|nr:hypothetical protein [Elusimicrobiota bacterium]
MKKIFIAYCLLSSFFIFPASYFLLSTLYLLLPNLYAEEVIFQEIIVRDGQTLWQVANEYLQDPQRWPDILKYNHLPVSDPYAVLPGMKLKVPVLLIKEYLRAAYLIHLVNRVDYRRKEENLWKKALTNMELYQGDGIRTLKASNAEIRFPTGELLRLHENSLAIVRPEEKREEVNLLAGELRASRAKVITASTIVEPKISPSGANPEFRTKIKEDKTTLVAVYKGEVDVTAQGKTVTVPAGFGSEIKVQTAPSLPIPLPSLEIEPQIKTAPAPTVTQLPITTDKERILPPSPVIQKFTLEMTLPKEIKKETVAGEETTPAFLQYHLQIAQDKEFKNLLIDETGAVSEKIELKHNLPDGTYFWRIAWFDPHELESKFSEPQSFTLDTKIPTVELFFPQENEMIAGEFIYLKGKTEKGVQILVDEKIIPSDEEGNFEQSLLYPPGKYKLTLTAIDSAGNKNILTRTIEKITPEEKIRRGEGKLGRRIVFTPAVISLGLLSLSIITYVLIIILR